MTNSSGESHLGIYVTFVGIAAAFIGSLALGTGMLQGLDEPQKYFLMSTVITVFLFGFVVLYVAGTRQKHEQAKREKS
jgi:ABC-type proline/glycine betaine transport system permease subunit